MTKKTKISLMGLACVIVFLMVFTVLWFTSWDYNNNSKRVEWTILSLQGARGGVIVFKERNGRFPDSLEELIDYGGKNPEANIYPGPVQELISNEKGNKSESRVLDGSGGIYYNNVTGEVRINLTKPLKDYLKYYFSHNRNEVPSEW
jgi:hypothetical protein